LPLSGYRERSSQKTSSSGESNEYYLPLTINRPPFHAVFRGNLAKILLDDHSIGVGYQAVPIGCDSKILLSTGDDQVMQAYRMLPRVIEAAAATWIRAKGTKISERMVNIGNDLSKSA
jgi:hypothetical protein